MHPKSFNGLEEFLGHDVAYVFDLSSFEEKEGFYWNNQSLLENRENKEKIYFPSESSKNLPNKSNFLSYDFMDDFFCRIYDLIYEGFSKSDPFNRMSEQTSHLVFASYALSTEFEDVFLATNNGDVLKGSKKLNRFQESSPLRVFYKTDNDNFYPFR
ncbi:MAG: hypothetical protein ABEI74_01290 [Candidatus Pacearchaeota archaeon]